MLSLMPVHANGYSNGNAPAAARITTVPSYAAARHASCASAIPEKSTQEAINSWGRDMTPFF